MIFEDVALLVRRLSNHSSTATRQSTTLVD